MTRLARTLAAAVLILGYLFIAQPAVTDREPDGPFELAYVIDGDTLILKGTPYFEVSAADGAGGTGAEVSGETYGKGGAGDGAEASGETYGKGSEGAGAETSGETYGTGDVGSGAETSGKTYGTGAIGTGAETTGETHGTRSGEFRVRLIGIDAPESASRDEYQNTPEGKLSAEFLRGLLAGDPQVLGERMVRAASPELWLEYGRELRDKYGRILAYVWIDTVESSAGAQEIRTESMLQALILEAGYAETMAIEQNTGYKDEFSRLEELAKERKAGLWDR